MATFEVTVIGIDQATVAIPATDIVIAVADVKKKDGCLHGVIRVINEGADVWRDCINLTREAARKSCLNAIGNVTGVSVEGDAILALEQALREAADQERLNRARLEQSNSRPEVVLSPAVRGLLEDRRLLDRLSEALRLKGWVGDTEPPRLAYHALTSRCLRQPLHVAFIAQPASGKNWALDRARDLMPPEAYHLERAGSDRALIYSGESFTHRTVIFGEADSIPDQGPAASAIRSLLSDNILAYDVVEQDPRTHQFTTRHIRKPGPTGLITTSTRSLGEQLGTRLLEVSVSDDPLLTRLILRAQAQAASEPSIVFDARDWIAAQEWLAASAPYTVRVPFAPALASRMPRSTAVRLRRDFPQLLRLIESVALLHILQRERQRDGAIVATLQDYAEARALLAPVFETTAAEGLTPVIRQTVEAVGETEVSQSKLSRMLGISRSTTSWRVERALKGGWLKNLETKDGRPARLVRGDPMSDAIAVLPTVEDLRAFEVSQSPIESVLPEVTTHQHEVYADPFESSNRIGDSEDDPPDPPGGIREEIP